MRFFGFFVVTALICGVFACSPPKNVSKILSISSSSDDVLMFVQDQPQTYGYRRLQYFQGRYADFSSFIEDEGVPEFLAEISKDSSQYLIVYYPAKTKAFAARIEQDAVPVVQFSGPYPITPSELNTLRQLKEAKD